MSNHNDQERALFEKAFPVPDGLEWNGTAYVTAGRQETSIFVHLCRVAAAYDKMYAVWQARAQLQHSSVAVPDGWKLVPVEPTPAIRNAIDLLCDDHRAFDDSESFWDFLLAAAPHPVSGEQSAAGFDKDLAMHLLSEAHGFASVSPRGKENIAAVMDMIDCIAAAPAAQDVSALIDVATGKIQHASNGLCPDQIEGFEVSDPDCPACRIITAHRVQPNAHPELSGLQAAYDLLLADGQGPMQTRVVFDRLQELRKEAGLAPLAPPVPGPAL